MSRAGITSVKEPYCLTRSDGKRPDGFTLIPWREGRSATWVVTVTDFVTAPSLSMSSACAAPAAQGNFDKYEKISCHHLSITFVIGTLGQINRDGRDFLSELGCRISAITCDPRETSFLYQLFNAV